MARKIVGVIKPFDMRQDVYVYEDGNKLDHNEPKMDNLSNVILALSRKFNLTEVDLLGPKQFTKGLVRQIKEDELNKYSENTLNINII